MTQGEVAMTMAPEQSKKLKKKTHRLLIRREVQHGVEVILKLDLYIEAFNQATLTRAFSKTATELL